MNRTVLLSDLTFHSYGSRTPSAAPSVASRLFINAAATLPHEEGNVPLLRLYVQSPSSPRRGTPFPAIHSHLHRPPLQACAASRDALVGRGPAGIEGAARLVDVDHQRRMVGGYRPSLARLA